MLVQCERCATEAGLGGGRGGLRLRTLQVFASLIVEHALLPLNEVRRISIACGEFRPRRLKQNLAVDTKMHYF